MGWKLIFRVESKRWGVEKQSGKCSRDNKKKRKKEIDSSRVKESL
jgi:hypothetical protein